MNETFRNLLFWTSLLGLPMSGTCTTGCAGGDGGAYTLTDFHQDNEKYGVEWTGKLKIGKNSNFYTKQEAGFNSPFEFEGEASNHKAVKSDSMNNAVNKSANKEDDDMTVVTTPENQ